MDGIYDTDFIECILWENNALNAKQYCQKGGVVCIRGRVQTRIVEEGGINKHNLQIIVEKITSLTSNKENTEVVKS